MLRTWAPGFDEHYSGGEEQAGQLIMWVETLIPQGDKCDGFVKNALGYHVYPVSRTTNEERAELSRGCGGGGGLGRSKGF